MQNDAQPDVLSEVNSAIPWDELMEKLDLKDMVINRCLVRLFMLQQNLEITEEGVFDKIKEKENFFNFVVQKYEISKIEFRIPQEEYIEFIEGITEGHRKLISRVFGSALLLKSTSLNKNRKQSYESVLDTTPRYFQHRPSEAMLDHLSQFQLY